MKVRVVVSLDGCEAASHVFDPGADNFGAGAQAAHDYFRENKPSRGTYDVARLKLVFEKGLDDRIEIFGCTSVGGDKEMVLSIDRTESEDLNRIGIFGGTQTGTDKGKVLKADRVEIVVDIELSPLVQIDSSPSP